MEVTSINERLAEIYSGTPWVIITEAAAAAVDTVSTFRKWGVDRFLVISATEGVGEVPEEVAFHYTRSQGETVMGGFRAFDRSLAAASVAEAIERFDPEGRARLLASPFGAEEAFADREIYGVRRPAWRGLEDKTVVDSILDDAGVPRAPSAVVPVSDAPAASAMLATDSGTVWVADNTDGWHGGGEYTRWVPSPDYHDRAVRWFSQRAERVRVMPFLDGLPCSIHGYATPTGVAAFRPVEMLIARTSALEPFQYMGMATTWDPPPALRDEMRVAAKRLAEYLRDRIDYRGPFSIDGVATDRGFRPTEVNPRMSAGLGIQAMGIDDLNLGLLTRALYEGDIELDTGWLESIVVSHADNNRVLRAGIPFGEGRDPDTIDVVLNGTALERTGSTPHGTLAIGGSLGGSYVLLKLDQEHIPVGPPAAPIAVSAARLASKTWDLGLLDVTPARDVVG